MDFWRICLTFLLKGLHLAAQLAADRHLPLRLPVEEDDHDLSRSRHHAFGPLADLDKRCRTNVLRASLRCGYRYQSAPSLDLKLEVDLRARHDEADVGRQSGRTGDGEPELRPAPIRSR